MHDLVLTESFNYPSICCRDNTTGHKQYRKFLQSRIDDNFVTQAIEKLLKGKAVVGLILKNKNELFGYVKSGHSLSCSDHEMTELRVLKGQIREKNRITDMDPGEKKDPKDMVGI